MVLIWGQQRICFVAFFLCVLRCFFSNTKWILGFMQLNLTMVWVKTEFFGLVLLLGCIGLD